MHMQINLMASVQDNYNTPIIFVYIKMIMAIYLLYIVLYCTCIYVYILFTYCHFVCIVSVIAGYCVYCFCYAG